jgi:Big-like domain-containing protein
MRIALIRAACMLIATAALAPGVAAAASWTVIGWNDLGMHCMDADYSVFAILPPFNTIHAQVIGPDGKLVGAQGAAGVGYRATTDASGSITTSSIGRTGFWNTCPQIFNASPAPDQGLAGFLMPGAANLEQPMHFDTTPAWYSAVGIPITPYDDTGHKNAYPMMRLTARDALNSALASTDIVLPVSDEMDCRACHASGSGDAAKPKAGWVNNADAQRDYRLNILRLHDDRQLANGTYTAALGTLSLNAAGLYVSATTDNHPMLCAACHASNALPGTGIAGITPLTEAMHAGHAAVADPVTKLTLGASENRSACYRCHPGSTTQCLRGAMGRAVASDGTLAMQCQSCHGSMATVGAHGRVGWLQEPRCDNCHTGTATLNSGQIRYTDAFVAPGVLRTAADSTFATNDNAPATGLSLYRFSFGHGGLACEACHGPTHAEAPSTHANDNIQNVALQGHEGVLAECGVCHRGAPAAGLGGPHNLHPLGQSWAEQHGNFVESNGNAGCKACHGGDFRGSVLGAMQADRTITTTFGTKVLWRGERISCYLCHDGPGSESATTNLPPTVADLAVQGQNTQSAAVTLTATDPNGDALTLRIVDQPASGTVAFDGHTATYFAPPGFSGVAVFTFAAWDGKAESNLGRVSVTIDRVFANGFE